jgi:hypothetical protein
MMFLCVCLELIIIASWSTWWQGASYSGRMFIGMLPLIAFGLAEIFRIIKNRIFQGMFVNRMIIGSFGLINIIMIIRFLLSH